LTYEPIPHRSVTCLAWSHVRVEPEEVAGNDSESGGLPALWRAYAILKNMNNLLCEPDLYSMVA